LEKKRLCFLVSFFVIVFWIWGLVTPTLSETLKCKSELLDEKIREEQQFDYTYSVGVNLTWHSQNQNLRIFKNP